MKESIASLKRYFSTEPVIIFAYLFGSRAKGRTAPFSDFDIAVYIASVKDLTEFKLQVLSKIIDILGTDKVDLILLNTASLSLKAQVLQKKVVLADKDSFLRHKFESLTLREYFDFSIKEREIFKKRYSVG